MILQSYLHYVIDDSYQGSIINWSYNQSKYSGDEIIEIMNKSIFNTKWQSLCKTPLNIKSAYGV